MWYNDREVDKPNRYLKPNLFRTVCFGFSGEKIKVKEPYVLVISITFTQ
jgi:hypothetical protein